MSVLQRLATLVALCGIAPTVLSASVEGYWLGTLQVNDAHELRLQLNVWSEESRVRCKLDSLDQNAYGLDCANARLKGNEFSFEIPAVAGRWSGTLADGGERLSGTWSQGQSWPLVFERQATLQKPPARQEPTYAPALPPVSAADMQTVLTKDFEKLLKSGPLAPGTGIGATIGVLSDGERRVFTFGAAQPDSLFEIGSITKTFTGLMLAQMIEQGRVSAEQPVRTLLPADAVPKPSGTEITLLDLVTQQSGLPRLPGNLAPANPADPYAGYSARHLYDYLARQGLDKSPDAPAVYSNLGFGLLGQALENRADVDYAVLLNRLVTAPLCMADTGVNLDESQRARLIQGYTHDRKPAEPWEFEALAGAGAIRSTAADMLKYLAAQLHPEPCESAQDLPQSQTLAAAIKRSHVPQAQLTPNTKIAYGWVIDPSTGTYWHNGGTGGYSSFAFFDIQDGHAAVVLTNLAVNPQGGMLADRLGDHIRRRLSGQPVIAAD